MAVVEGRESVAAYDLVLQLLDLLAVELDQRAAAGADQMIVMRVLVIMFVKHASVVKLKLASEAALLE